MYVTTFYSYKGGVGRTLALVNVAYELAKSGQNVLVVDFDLEAPAIHSGTWRGPAQGPPHQEGRARSTHPGIVEYVGRFINTMRAPRAEDHIVDATPTDDEKCAGKIALMPSGALNDEYGRRLSAIDWNELYRKYDGYVMFEDLREQWRILGYDYVLLDSRTGVTDVGGICTRHLPDAVVMMFRPDDQSLEGTAGVADAIRNERPAPGRSSVRLHFVMAAIPDVDDEDGILDELRERFRRRLNISVPSLHFFPTHEPLQAHQLLEIRHYQSMDLLQQPIYTDSRPRTKLARSFQELTKRLRSANIDDRDGVLEYLKRGGDFILEPHDDILDEIHRRYSNDLDVLDGLASVYGTRWHHIPRAIDLLEQIAELGTLSPHQLVKLADMRRHTGDDRGSLQSLTAFFQSDHTTSRQSDSHTLLRRALTLLEMLGEDRVGYVDDSPVVTDLPAAQRAALAIRLDLSQRERQAAVKILESILSGGEGSPVERERWRWGLALARVAVGDFARAAGYYRSAFSEETGRTVQTAFMLAMANWGDSGLADAGDFRQVLNLRDEENVHKRHPDPEKWSPLFVFDGQGFLNVKDAHERPSDPDYLQAIALAEWFAGRREDAGRLLDDARQKLLEERPFDDPHQRHIVSCWSFTRVSASTFIEHCDEISRLFDGFEVKPVFMRAAEEAEADSQATSSSVAE